MLRLQWEADDSHPGGIPVTLRIDAHQHFWRYRPDEFPWIDTSMAGLRRDRLPGDLAPLLRNASMDACIAVQARQGLDESRFLLRMAHENPFIVGVVGWADLCDPGAGGQLAAFAIDRKFVGVRHLLQDEPADDFMLRPEFVRGVAAAGAAGLAYDLLVFPRHLPFALALVRRLPEVRFIVDHLAKPAIAAGAIGAWEPAIRALAAEPNVVCKVSGMVTEAGPDWTASTFTPFLDTVFDAFGPERLLFGSDWPVCELAASYARVAGIVEDYLSPLPAPQREAVMGGNALRWYRLQGNSMEPAKGESNRLGEHDT